MSKAIRNLLSSFHGSTLDLKHPPLPQTHRHRYADPHLSPPSSHRRAEWPVAFSPTVQQHHRSAQAHPPTPPPASLKCRLQKCYWQIALYLNSHRNSPVTHSPSAQSLRFPDSAHSKHLRHSPQLPASERCTLLRHSIPVHDRSHACIPVS